MKIRDAVKIGQGTVPCLPSPLSSHDFEFKGGWGLIVIFVAPQFLVSGVQTSGAST